MKTILAAVTAIAVLSGCATQPAYYTSQRQVVGDPYQWHTVSVTPANGAVSSGPVYTTEELPAAQPRVVYTTEPAYAQRTVYVTQPVYAPPAYYYEPAVSVGLGFVLGSWCCGSRGHWGGGRGYHRR